MPEGQRLTILRRAVRNVCCGLVIVGGLSLFLNLLALTSPLYSAQVFDHVLTGRRAETLVALTALAAFAFLCLATLEVIRKRILSRISTWLNRTLWRPVFGSSVDEALAGRPSGAQPIGDLAQICGFIDSHSICPIFDAPWTPIFVGVIWLMHPWLGMLAVISAVVLLSLALIDESVTRAPLADAGQAWLAAQRKYEATMCNAEVVQALGMLPALLKGWQGDYERMLDDRARASDRTGWMHGFCKFFRPFVQMAILGLGAFLILRGEFTSGGMVAASILLGRALAPVEQVISASRRLVAARASYRRLRLLLQRHAGEPFATQLPAPEGRISAEQVGFSAPDGRPILKNVSFELSAGEVLAVVGPSASGKSTLCRLLTGVWAPSCGNVRLDGTDVHIWDRVEFGRHVGYLPQDVELFSGSVHDNIARMRNASDQEVIVAAQLAGVHDMILHLSDGYLTEVGLQGVTLSGGQRQCIGLARAMFGSPRIVILDEPSASLDQAGENAMLDAIGRLKERGTTVVLVVHRPNLLTHVDKVLVLSRGASVLFGPRDQVLTRIAVPASARPVVETAL